MENRNTYIITATDGTEIKMETEMTQKQVRMLYKSRYPYKTIHTIKLDRTSDHHFSEPVREGFR